MRKLKLSEIVLDYDLHPRNKIDEYNVARIHEALKAGETLDPLIICKESKRVVDGFHRHKGYSRFSKGEDIQVEVIEREYKNEGELFLDAIRYNSVHGVNLDSYDRQRCIKRAAELKIDEELLAKTMSLTFGRYQKLKSNMAVLKDGTLTPLKATFRKSFKGKMLDEKQQKVNESSSGMNIKYHLRQVIDALSAGMVEIDDATYEMLEELDQILENIKTKQQ